ncbi:Soluble guanylate cyclase beta 3 subunit [Fasciolopsis buskii]|uniref:Soluble guanylate cyclase beta 3 subunit n=1 Tax=Fasciolopsis buskii TaxID=27845 RepID=A0A8E0VP76_9TREM|nr:Soluble guanylate cyclase beta 3 subunit [Fasciolopsis buski]
MYGLLIVGVQHFIESQFGVDSWTRVVEKAGLGSVTYQTQNVYSETVIERVLDVLTDETGLSLDELSYQSGLYFVTFTTQYGYKKLLRVQGRDFINFLRNLDNLHEHLRFSYPKIRPPSFFVKSKSVNKIELVYSSKRLGFVHYVRGQLVALARQFFGLDIRVDLIGHEREGLVNHFTYEIIHTKNGWGTVDLDTEDQAPTEWGATIQQDEFFPLFSFFLVLTRDLRIKKASSSFVKLDPHMEGSYFVDKFLIARPYIDVSFEVVSRHTACIF